MCRLFQKRFECNHGTTESRKSFLSIIKGVFFYLNVRTVMNSYYAKRLGPNAPYSTIYKRGH